MAMVVIIVHDEDVSDGADDYFVLLSQVIRDVVEIVSYASKIISVVGQLSQR